jgi:hypothetical protein
MEKSNDRKLRGKFAFATGGTPGALADDAID